MIKKGMFLVASIGLLAGCAAPPTYDWVKADTTKAVKDNNVSECVYQVRLNKTPANEQGELVRLCMQGKGFRYVRTN